MSLSKKTQANTLFDYQTALSKGRKLLKLMRANPNPTASTTEPAKFTPADLDKWGWSSHRSDTVTVLEEHADFLASLGTNACVRPYPYDGTGGDNIDLARFHILPVTINSTLYSATDGYFMSIMNWKAGLLIANNNASPSTKASRRHEKSSTINPSTISLPPLRHSSDVAYLRWCQLPSMGVSSSPLRYTLRANVQNSDSVAIMSRVLGFTASPLIISAESPKRPGWPGISYNISTLDAQALLGTPNGAGVGYLVAQYKKELQVGCVEKITIYFTNCDGLEKVKMLFWLGDGVAGTGKDEEKKVVRGV